MPLSHCVSAGNGVWQTPPTNTNRRLGRSKSSSSASRMVWSNLLQLLRPNWNSSLRQPIQRNCWSLASGDHVPTFSGSSLGLVLRRTFETVTVLAAQSWVVGFSFRDQPMASRKSHLVHPRASHPPPRGVLHDVWQRASSSNASFELCW